MDSFTYGNDYITPSLTPSMGSTVWSIVSLILAFVGCFLVYFLFVVKKQNPKQKFLAWLKEFLDFKKMLIEPIIKISYLFFAIFITLVSFSIIGSSFVGFLATLIGGNILLRVCYEAMIMMLMIWKNTTEINKKLK